MALLFKTVFKTFFPDKDLCSFKRTSSYGKERDMSKIQTTELERYRQAIEKTIQEHHAANHPVYQCKEGYIVAIYPGGKEVRLQKAKIS